VATGGAVRSLAADDAIDGAGLCAVCGPVLQKANTRRPIVAIRIDVHPRFMTVV
jgi:hypothetical protein